MPKDTMYCFRRPGGDLRYFYPHPDVVRWSVDEDEPGEILHVQLVPDDTGTYWCWHDAKDDEFYHVYHDKKLLEMCFPYGIQAEIDRGFGTAVRVRVEVLGEPLARHESIRKSNPNAK